MTARAALATLALLLAARGAEARTDAASRRADSAARAPVLELLVLHATHQRRGVDPRLRELPELTRPPFSRYESYALVERARLPLVAKHRSTYRLPNGRVLASELVDVPERDVVRLSASISEPGGDAFLPLLEVRARLGQRFIVAGQKFQSGILVLVLTLVQ